MPLYEYQCDACGHRFELIQKFSDPPPQACTSCSGGPVTKLLSSPAFQFKGSGWYITDYARKGASPDAGSESKPAGESAEKPAADSSKSTTSSPSTSPDASSS